jgi:NAD(P)-dependent dehydrogenase (short-subunit alcohol dehydrogenase family)
LDAFVRAQVDWFTDKAPGQSFVQKYGGERFWRINTPKQRIYALTGRLPLLPARDVVLGGSLHWKANRASVADAEGAASIVDDALSAFGRIDIVINNAGCLILDEFEKLPVEALMTTLEVHVKGAFQVSQRAWTPMRKQGGGRILNVASLGGNLVGNMHHAAYDAAKGGLSGLTRSMAIEGEQYGISVNGLFPGAYTRMVKTAVASVDKSISPEATIDMRAELVAPTACWLVHEECGLTGAFFASSSGRIGRVFAGAAAASRTSRNCSRWSGYALIANSHTAVNPISRRAQSRNSTNSASDSSAPSTDRKAEMVRLPSQEIRVLRHINVGGS